MKTQSTEIIRTKRTSLLINKCTFDDDFDFDEDTDDEIQIENQPDIDSEDDDYALESIYENDVSINFIIIEHT
jgi:hypothetical protein